MPENLQEMPTDPSTGTGVALPPVSPEEAPMQDPSMMGGQPQTMSEDELAMRSEIERMFGKIEKKNNALEEKQTIDSEKIENLKADVVRRFFKMMKDLGVDPSDLNSINEFLQKLQQQDPDLYIIFASAINSLSSAGENETPMSPGMEAAPGVPGMEATPGVPGMEAAPGVPEEEGLMKNNTTNLQENILRQ